MPNYKAESNIILDNHLATGTEATYTFTPAIPLDMKTKYHEIVILIRGKATAALALQMKTNAATDYNNSTIEHDTTTLAGALGDAASVLTLLGSVIIDGAVSFIAKVSIIFNDADDTLMIVSKAGAPHEGSMSSVAQDVTSATTITSIEIKTSTSTWIAGTEITTYGIKR